MSNFYNQQKTNAAYVVLLLFAFFAIAGTARAQLASTYVFATGTGATLQNMTGATQLIGAGVDDGQSAIFNIGFDFTFENVTYKQFSASSNGVIRLGGTAVGTGFTNSAASTAIQPKIMPMWDDICTGTGGVVNAIIVGTAPNRILVINHFGRMDATETSASNSTFQTWLYEGTNVIEFRYGAGVNPVGATIGIGGAAGANYMARNSATLQTAASTGGVANIATWPGSGRFYTFTPPTAAYRAYIYNINAGSATWCQGETRNITLSVKNTGTATWTDAGPNDINIGCKWNTNGTSWNDYFVRVDAGAIAPGATANYTMSLQANTNVAGTYGAALATGTNNITFDLVREALFWFNTQSPNANSGTAVTDAQTIANASIACTSAGITPANNATGVCYAGNGAVSSVAWTAVSGATAYDVYFGTAANPPLVSSNQAGTAYITGALAANTQYYWRVVPKNNCATATCPTVYTFTTLNTPCGCTNPVAGLYPATAVAAPAPGNTTQIATNQYEGEYNQISGVTAGHTFVSTMNLASAFITVRSGTFNGPQVAFGQTPLTWTGTAGGTYFIHYNTNAACGTASTNRTTTIQNITAVNQSFSSCTVAQASTAAVEPGGSNYAIVNLQVVMSGAVSPLNCTSITFNTTGTTNAANLTNAMLYYTGTTGTFSTATPFGAAQANPNGTYSITGTQALANGTNHFWLAYDIAAGATIGNVVDAQITSCTVDGTPRTPTATNPAGTRVVLNDNPCSAATLTGGSTCSPITNTWTTSATASAVPNSCTGNPDDDVWYKFTATQSSAIIIVDGLGGSPFACSTLFGSVGYDPQVQFFYSTGFCPSPTLTSLGCIDNTACGGTESIALTGLIVGGVYYVRVFEYNGGSDNDGFTICLVNPPVNDDCADAITLTVGAPAISGTTTNATETFGSTAGNDVWYKFTPCATGSHTITTSGPSPAKDLNIRVYAGPSCPGTYPGTVFAQGTTTSTSTETVTATFTSGVTYYILVQDFNYTGGTFNIAVTGPVASLDLTNTGTPATGFIAAGTTNTVLHGFALTPVCSLSSYDFTSLTVNNSGSALSSDITSIRVFYDANNSGTWDGGDVQVSTPQGLSALMSFTITGQTGVSGIRRYLVVGNVATNATGGNTFIAGATTAGTNVAVNGTATGNTLTISPINNECTGAIAFGTLGAGCTSVNVNTGGATQSVAGCSGTADDDVWFTFTMPAGSTSISFTNTNISGNADRVLQFYSGTCGSLTSLLCSDPETGILSGLTPGATYYVRAYTVTSGVSSQFSLCIALPPANNDCAGAIAYPTLAPGCTNVDVNTIGATQSLVANCTGTADDDVWYSFVEPVGYTTLTYSMTDISGNSDRVIEFYNSSCGVGSIYCSTNETGNLTGLVGGNTYWVRVYTAGAAVTSNFTLCLALPPANDDCAGAIAFPTLQPGCNTVTANTGAATASGVAAPCTGTADDDVWYSFVIASSTSVGYSMTNVSGNTDRVIEFYSTSCGGTSIYCNTAESGLLGTLAAGTYWVRVFTAGSAVNSEFDLCIALPPANDAPCNAAVLASPDLCNPLVGTTQMATASQGTNGVPAGCAGTADDDVWYSFVATSTAHTVTVVGSTGFNAVVQVYTLSGTCPGSATYTAVANSCSNATGAGGTESLIIRGLTIGVTYYVRVHDSAAGASTSPTFTICVVENPLGIPVTYYDFENNANRTQFQNVVEQSVNSANAFTKTGGAFTSQGGAGAAVYGGAAGTAITGTLPDGSATPTTNPSEYIEVSLNTSGLQTLSIDFDIYCNYEDYFLFQLWPDVGVNYSTDGGSTWNLLTSFATDWGIWQFPADPLILPVSCNNNPNVKIRFYGFNTLGAADFAIDNFTMFAASTTAGAGVKNLIDLTQHYSGTRSTNSASMYTYDKFTANGAGTTVNLVSSDISLSNQFNVTSGATLNFGTGITPRYSLNTGASAFNLDPTATIGVTDVAGITTTGNTGNVRSTGTRTYSTTANYNYIDNAAQVTGNGMPLTVNNLTINNSAGVTITNAGVTVNGALNLTSGILRTTTLATDNVVIGAAGSVLQTTGWVYGNLRKPVIAGSPIVNFEVGNLTNYTPVSLSFTGVSGAGNYTARAVIGAHPNIGSSCLNTSKYVNQYWKLVNGGVTATNYSALFNYTAAELIGAPTATDLVVGRFNSGWTYPTVTPTPSSTDLTASAITADGDFQIAQGIVPSVTVVQSPTGAVCSGSNVTFTATPTNGGTTPGYEFFVNGVSAQNSTSATFATSTLATGNTVTVELTSNAGCIVADNTATPVTPITMTVNPAPSLVITPPTGGCSGGSVDITVAGVAVDTNNVAGTLSYHTTLANANANIAMGSPNAITTAGTYYIKKTATSGGCSDVEAVVVSFNPVPDLVIVDPPTVCAPATVDLTAVGVATDANGTVGSLTYYTNATDAAAGTNPINYASTISVSGFYFIRKTTNVGGCFDYDAVYADISLLPNLVITNPAPACNPGTIDITAPSVVNDLNGTIGTLSYHTTLANANANIAMSNPDAIATSGTYYIKKTTSAGGCSDVEAVVVTVSNVPNLVITNPAPVCSPATVNITSPSVYSDINATAGFVNYFPTLLDAQNNTNALSTPAAITTSGTYYIKKTTSVGGCTDIEPVTVAINNCGTLTWDGSVSTDWNDANNWTPAQVPTIGDDIVIPNLANDPALSSGAMGACKDVSITGGAPISIASGYTLDVKGNWTGTTSTIVSGAGKTIFSGTTGAQTITGGGTFSTLQINNANGASITSGGNVVRVTTALELRAGVLTTNGNLQTISSASSTAYINDFSSGFTGSLSGLVSVERFIPPSPNGFRYIGQPVNTGAGVMAISAMQGFTVTGSPGQTIPLPTCSPTFTPINVAQNSPYGNLMYFQENGPYGSPACRQRGWWFQTSGTLTVGRGYGIKQGGNTKITYRGTANTGTITSAATSTHTSVFSPAGNNGWNLVSNPYPSAITIDEMGGNPNPLNDMPAGYDKQIQFYITGNSNLTGSYQTYNIAINGAADIALGQGFWVRVTTPGTTPAWTLGQGHRTTQSPTYFDVNPLIESHLKVNVSGNGFADLSNIYFVNGAESGLDIYDGNKWNSATGQPTLYTKAGEEVMGINSLPSLSETMAVPMGLTPGANGNFTFTFEDIASFPQTAMIYLEDLKLGTMNNLRDNATYEFAANLNDNPDRFMLHFQPGLQAEVADQDCDNAGSIELTQPAPTVWSTYEVKGNDNNVYATGTNLSGTVTVSNLPAQEYVVTVTHPSGYSAQEYITVNGSNPISASINASSTLVMVDEMVTLTANATNASEYVWNFGDGNTQTGSANVVHAYDAEGTYNVTLTASNSDCNSEVTKIIKVNNNATGLNGTAASNLNIYGQGERVVIEFNKWGGDKADIFMYNTLGQRMESLTGVSTLKGRQELYIADIKPGYYFIQVVSNGEVLGKKVFLGKQ